MKLKQVTIIGVGLLGGSIGLALKAAGENCRVMGFGHRRETLEKAAEYGVVDAWSLDIHEALSAADLVILCTPVSLFEQAMGRMAGALKRGAIVTDVGSTKRTVVGLAQKLLPRTVHFVGSHPMAGSEKRGVEYARADLFKNATCIITPTASSPAPAARTVETFWKTLGMHIVRLSPEEHDAAVSDISHLPHLLASALVAMQSRSALPLAGKGFLDTTRVASGDAALWRDILLDNQDNVRASLERLQKELAALKTTLTPSRAESLTVWLAAAAHRRDELALQKLKEISGE